jgi:hypothetical protein
VVLTGQIGGPLVVWYISARGPKAVPISAFRFDSYWNRVPYPPQSLPKPVYSPILSRQFLSYITPSALTISVRCRDKKLTAASHISKPAALVAASGRSADGFLCPMSISTLHRSLRLAQTPVCTE